MATVTNVDPPDVDEDAVADALDILQEIPVWQLAPSRWDQVSELLDGLASTIEPRDPTAVLSAVAALRRNGPIRVRRIGFATATTVPGAIADRCDVLTHGFIRLLRSESPEAGHVRTHSA